MHQSVALVGSRLAGLSIACSLPVPSPVPVLVPVLVPSRRAVEHEQEEEGSGLVARRIGVAAATGLSPAIMAGGRGTAGDACVR
jgi:hypothetical protein